MESKVKDSRFMASTSLAREPGRYRCVAKVPGRWPRRSLHHNCHTVFSLWVLLDILWNRKQWSKTGSINLLRMLCSLV